MTSSILTNTQAGFVRQSINQSLFDIRSASAKLSTGKAITSAFEDAAGLSIGSGLKTDTNTLKTALKTTGQAKLVLNIADGALENISAILQRQKSLAVQANNGTLSDTERGFLDLEFQNGTKEIDRLIDATTFNGVQLLNGGIQNATTTIKFIDGVVVADRTIYIGDIEIVFTNAGTTDLNGNPNQLTIDTRQGAEAFTATDKANILANIINGIGGVTETTTLATISGLNIKAEVFHEELVLTTTNNTGIRMATIGSISDLAEYVKRNNDNETSESRLDLARGFGGIHIDMSTYSQTAGGSANALSINGVVFGVTGNTTNQFGNLTAAGTISNPILLNGTSALTFMDQLNDIVNGDIVTASERVKDAFRDFSTTLIGTGEILVTSSRDEVSFSATGTTGVEVAINNDSATAVAIADTQVDVGIGDKSLGFQVGFETTDLIRVGVDNTKTNKLYNLQPDEEKVSVGNINRTIDASMKLDAAIDTIKAVRASVGSLQARFEFASANIATSVQNTEAAAAGFLDADIALESTVFAQSQVRMQAGISVLAQINQLPQALLKLIG